MLQTDNQILAQEIAETFLASSDSPGMLDRYFALRNACDEALWRDVITVLVQMRD